MGMYYHTLPYAIRNYEISITCSLKVISLIYHMKLDMFRNNLVLHNWCTVGGFKLQQSVMFGYKQSVIIACESECFIQNYFIRLNSISIGYS